MKRSNRVPAVPHAAKNLAAILLILASPLAAGEHKGGPKQTIVKVGETATFTARYATPPPYQWYKGGTEKRNKIEGATGASYTTPPTTMADNLSYYFCRGPDGSFLGTPQAACLYVHDEGEQLVDWVQVTAAPEYPKRDHIEPMVHQDRAWIIGGWTGNPDVWSPRDVWSSADGKNWTLVQKEAPFTDTEGHMTCVFADKMWQMGGDQCGPIKPPPMNNTVWSSSDGVSWTRVVEHAGWELRTAGSVAVFRGKMWVMGGVAVDAEFKNKQLKNDIWCSSDGARWELVAANAPWEPRSDFRNAVLNGKLYLFGGRGARWYQDVWSSDDGSQWTKLTDKAPWHARGWFPSVVYRDRMWLLGGTGPDNANDVWYSKDGKDWRQLKSRVVWSQRHGHGAWVLHDRIYIAGGSSETGGNALDGGHQVWSLEVPKGYFRD